MRTIKKLGFHLVSERRASAFLTMLSVKQDIKADTDTILTPLVWRSQVHPSVPYVLVTETSSRSIGLEDVCDTCCRRFTSKQTSAARHKNVLAQRPCQHLAETLK